MPDTEHRSIADLIELQRSGRSSAEQLVADRLRAIRADPTGLHAVIESDAHSALAAARSADHRRRAGEPLGPLHGVPLTIKAAFAVAGLHASVGTADSRVAATEDAPAVARLRAAGAILLGTTNVPPMLDGFFSDSPLGGRTANPWDTSRTPGGSSGGSAAAVSAGWSTGDLGSDLSGSIRVPAAWCGVYGHRPSPGTVSKRGHLPWPIDAHLETPLSVAGPLARSADDLARLFDVLLRTDPAATRLAPTRMTSLQGLRVGVWREEPGGECDPEVEDALDGLLVDVEAAGCRLTDIRGTAVGTPEAAELFEALVAHEIAFGSGIGDSVAQAWQDWDRQLAIQEAWAQSIGEVDVVLAPAVGVVAPLHGAVQADPALRRRVGRWSAMANLVAAPATVIPMGLGRSSGMPVSAQVLAPFGHDRSTLAFAQLLERAGIVRPLIPPL